MYYQVSYVRFNVFTCRILLSSTNSFSRHFIADQNDYLKHNMKNLSFFFFFFSNSNLQSTLCPFVPLPQLKNSNLKTPSWGLPLPSHNQNRCCYFDSIADDNRFRLLLSSRKIGWSVASYCLVKVGGPGIEYFCCCCCQFFFERIQNLLSTSTMFLMKWSVHCISKCTTEVSDDLVDIFVLMAHRPGGWNSARVGWGCGWSCDKWVKIVFEEIHQKEEIHSSVQVSECAKESHRTPKKAIGQPIQWREQFSYYPLWIVMFFNKLTSS